MRVTNDDSRHLAARWKLRAAVAGVAAAGLVVGTVALTGSAAVAGAPRDQVRIVKSVAVS